MRYLDHYKSDPRIVNFFSTAADCLVHGEMLVLALGTPYSTPDDTDHYRTGYPDNVNTAMRLLTESVDSHLLVHGDFKPSAQQRFFGVEGRFGKDVKPPRNDGEMFSHSILYTYSGIKANIYTHYGWRHGVPDTYKPIVTTRPADTTIDGSGYHLLIDNVIVDQSFHESDLFDDHSEAILDDPQRAYLWRESARVLSALPRKPLRERRMDWCEMGQHTMESPHQSYIYSWLDIRGCKSCTDNHIAIYFPGGNHD